MAKSILAKSQEDKKKKKKKKKDKKKKTKRSTSSSDSSEEADFLEELQVQTGLKPKQMVLKDLVRLEELGSVS